MLTAKNPNKYGLKAVLRQADFTLNLHSNICQLCNLGQLLLFYLSLSFFIQRMELIVFISQVCFKD